MSSEDKPFWATLGDAGDAVALRHPESGQLWSYRCLAQVVAEVRAFAARSPRGVAFVFGENDFGGIASYLGCLMAGHAVYLLSTSIHHPSVNGLIGRYRPELILSRLFAPEVALDGNYSSVPGVCGYQAYMRWRCEDPPPDPDLALLLSTSASTGNPKTVRISRRALAASVGQVIGALEIAPCDHAVTSLPFTHVYGLSMVNSHLAAGACISLEKRSVADPGFWRARAGSPWSTLAGVTVTYELMRQRGVDAGTLGGIRKLLHSGSRMPADVFSWLYSRACVSEAYIYLMYGQTEACGRMSVLQPKMLPALATSVGKSVSGGQIAIDGEQEILYSGPNVMLGYARGRADLSAGDEMRGLLHTGDHGYQDSDGQLFVTGRRDRTCKMFGQRICLDDIEEFLRDVSPIAAISHGDHILLFSEAAESDLLGKLVAMGKTFRLPPQTFVLRRIESLPRTEAGKVCYRDLIQETADRA